MNNKEKERENIIDTDNDSKSSHTKVFLLLCVVIALVFVAIGPSAFSSDWVSSSDFHACIEISSSFIAIIAAVACLMYYFGLKSRFFLIIGLGFFVCGGEDLVHGIFGFKRLFTNSNIDFSRFIPGTYVAGRITLAIMIIAAPIVEYVAKKAKNIKREAIVFSSIAVTIGGGLTALALIIHLPQFIYPDRLISRPVDFISAILFMVAFGLIIKQFRHQRDIFSGSLLVCILLNIGGQVYMSFSKQLFDIFFDIAHFANILSYCAPVTGITIQTLQEMKKARQAEYKLRANETELRRHRDELKATNQQLTANEQHLKAFNQQLNANNQQLQASKQHLKAVNQQLESEVAERKKAEQALKKSNRELKEFTYVASHDLHEPLRKISSFGKLLSDSLKDKLSRDDKENLEYMIDGANRMQQRIEALLTYSRVTTKSVEFVPVDLNKVVEELCEIELAVKIEETGTEIEVPEQLGNIKCDPAQIRQLMQNFIANAIKYQKKDTTPEVVIRTRSLDDGMVRVEVQDNGIGIKENDFKNVFVMFKRLHSMSEYEGTGIGLAVCKKIVERHGGNIGVSSTYGEGSTFWFTMPAVTAVKEFTPVSVSSET